MKVICDINREDFWNFNKYAMFNIPTFRRNFITNLILVPVILIGIMYLFRDTLYLPMPLVILITILASIIGDILFIYITKSQIMKIPLNKVGILGEHTVELNDSGVRETSAVNEIYQSWEGVYNVVQNKGYIFIFLDSVMAILIPKRSFNTLEKANEFYAEAYNLWNNNVNKK